MPCRDRPTHTTSKPLPLLKRRSPVYGIFIEMKDRQYDRTTEIRQPATAKGVYKNVKTVYLDRSIAYGINRLRNGEDNG